MRTTQSIIQDSLRGPAMTSDELCKLAEECIEGGSITHLHMYGCGVVLAYGGYPNEFVWYDLGRVPKKDVRMAFERLAAKVSTRFN